MTRRRSFGLLHLEDRLAPAVATWDGGGADNKWTTAANWVGDVAPQAGDDVDFPGGVAQKTAINDFATGTGFNSLAVYEAGYTIGGNAVTLTAGVTADVKFANNQFDSTLALPINGAGGLATTDGNLILAAANSYSGVTTVTAGVLTLQTNTALGATGAGNGTILDGGNIRLDADGLTVAEAFIAMPVSGNGGNGFSLQAFRRAGTLAGPITLGSFAFIGAPGVFSKLTVAGGVTETGGPQSLWVEGIAFAAGTTVAVTGTTTVNGDAAFDATGPTGPIRVMTGNISGSGTVGAIAPADPSGNYSLSPGPLNGPGTLTTAGLSANTSFTYFTFDLGVTTDRIVVNGSVHLGGQLETHFFPDFHPVVGQHYRLIDNDGTDAITGAFSNVVEGQLMLGGNDTVLRATYHGGTGNDFELIAEPAANGRLFAVGAGAGGLPLVNIYNGDGVLVRSFLAYEASFRGGVHVTVTDLNNDGVQDVITAPGYGGGPVVRIWDGRTGAMIREFLAYDAAFRGGVNVATGYVNADQTPDIITGAGQGGGPHVKAFDLTYGPVVIVQFLAYDASFRGGVSVAGGEPTFAIHGELTPGTIITGAGLGGGPHVRIFNSVTGAANGPGFFAYDASFTGGVNVAYDRLFPSTIVTAPGRGGGPVVRGFSTNGGQRFQFLAYSSIFSGGVSVAVLPLDPNGANSIVTGPGPGGGPDVRIWNENGTTIQHEFLAFDPTFIGGIYVG